MRVNIPSPLRSYTHQATRVDADGSSLKLLLQALDAAYPGLRFRIIDEQERIREHIKIFVNQDQVESLEVALSARDEVHIICALSGG